MAIVTSGKWWRGTEFADLEEYLRNLTSDGYPAGEIRQCRCECGATIFTLDFDRNEGCAKRTCSACQREALICDSDDVWSEAEPSQRRCVCRKAECQVGVAFSDTESDEIRWITIGTMCAHCGVLGSPVDWKVDMVPSRHLRNRV